MTISGLRKDIESRFKKAGIECPEADTEWLLASLIECSRSELPLHLNRNVSENEINTLMDLVERREKREPLQHIFNSTNFYGLEFKVSKAALVPRPETEQIIELTAKDLAKIPSPLIYDFGTGSGCLAITLAKQHLNARIIASDISQDAIQLAKRNAVLHGVADRIDFREENGLALKDSERAHLIVSNPPYIPTKEIPLLQPEVKEFDPHTALDGGCDGLDYYRMLAKWQRFLTIDGSLIAEIGDDQKEAIYNIFRESNWQNVRFKSDLSGKPRIVIATG